MAVIVTAYTQVSPSPSFLLCVFFDFDQLHRVEWSVGGLAYIVCCLLCRPARAAPLFHTMPRSFLQVSTLVFSFAGRSPLRFASFSSTLLTVLWSSFRN